MMTRLLFVVAAAVAASAAQAEPPIEYVVRLDDARSQLVHITMIVRNVTTPTLDVALPVWRPGRYEVLEPAGTIRTLSARSGAGRVLKAEKTSKSVWRVEAADEVVIDYTLYANSLGNRTRHADATHAFLSGSTVFLFCPDRREDGPLRITLSAPESWRVATGLEPEAGDPRVLTAENYDVLVDSPIEIGELETLAFDVEGKRHEIAIWRGGDGPAAYDSGTLVRDFEKIVREQTAIFGSAPYQRYVFLLHVYPGGGGGTEHLNSTIMQASPSRFETPERYRGFLGLVSHEFFHTWNVKQFRPAGIQPYDYLRENYTRLLWVAEGTTSYYDDLTLARTGLMKPDDYLKAIGDGIHGLRRHPGAEVQSLEDASFDAWIKFTKSWPDSGNTTVSFYSKGALASLVLDLEVRRLSGHAASLDDVMRDLFEEFKWNGPGYTTDDLLRLLRRRAGTGFEEFFERHIGGVEPLDFESALRIAGLELVFKEPDKKPGEDAAESDDARAYLGINLSDQGGLAAITSVSANGPAFAAGLIAGDQVMALNGQRVTAGGLQGLLKKVEPGDTVRISYFRYDTLHETDVVAGEQSKGRWTVRRLKDATDEQKAVYASWLKQPWPEDSKNALEKEGTP